MSQDIRHYDTIRLDNDHDEAGELSVTATVGPTGNEWDNSRGVQITLPTPNGCSYARLTEPQIRDLIDVLEERLDPDSGYEATGIDSADAKISPDGSINTNQ